MRQTCCPVRQQSKEKIEPRRIRLRLLQSLPAWGDGEFAGQDDVSRCPSTPSTSMVYDLVTGHALVESEIFFRRQDQPVPANKQEIQDAEHEPAGDEQDAGAIGGIGGNLLDQ